MQVIPIKIEFSGGAELLFGSKKKHDVVLPKKENDYPQPCLLSFPDLNSIDFFTWEYYQELVYSKECHGLEESTRKLRKTTIKNRMSFRHLRGTMQDLIFWMKDNLLQERPELFMQDDSVRPGILVLVNDSDWELLDTLKYIIQPKDIIVFISTLHGG